MTLDHQAAGDLLSRFAAARSSFDGDAWIDLFSADSVWHDSPFAPVRSGSNDLRRLLLEAAEREEQVEWTFERHWVVPPTILASWHSSHVRLADRARVRSAGFAAFEIDNDGRIRVVRLWPVLTPLPE